MLSHIDAVLDFAGVVFSGIIAVLIAMMNARLARASAQTKEVARTLERNTKLTDAKLDGVAEKIEIVHHATNGMKAQLEKAAFAAGQKDQKENPT